MGPTTKSEDFTVHTDPLKDSSDFFRAALDGDWLERSEGKIDLPDDDPSIFQIFIHWMYAKEIDLEQGPKEPRPWRDIPTSDLTASDVLIDCFILDDKRGAVRFRNDVIDALIAAKSESHSLPDLIAISYAFENTPLISPLRTLLEDIWTWDAENYEISRLDPHSLPSAFLYQCWKKLHCALEDYGGDENNQWLPLLKAPFRSRRCASYHEHVAGEEIDCMRDATST